MSAAQHLTVVIPESAPFTPEQRSWLSGFFSASIAAMAEAAPVASNDPGSEATAPGGPVLAANDEAPWHDPSLQPEERMEMAKDRPIAPRLMAAMAQQDCGQCGYNCADYANAIFKKSEERLNLCAPGGKITARLLKGLAVELNDTNGDKTAAVEGAADGGKSRSVEAAQAALPGPRARAPAEAVFRSRQRLNADGSAKDTWHIEFDLSNSGVNYAVGDSFGVFPKNNLGLVDQIIAMLGASHLTEVRGRTLRQVLREDVDLGLAPDGLFELFSYITGGAAREKARALAKGEDPDGDAGHLDVLAVLHKFPSARPHPEAFVDALQPLQPRLYSISSSPNYNAGGLSLTVDAVRYQVNKRKRTGVASTFLAERSSPGRPSRSTCRRPMPSRCRRTSRSPSSWWGRAPAWRRSGPFLQERKASGAPGKNWLFFGHQKQATDFFYRDEFEALRKDGILTRLSLAWSRDAGEKFYVQDRMREVGPDLWRWLEEGAHVYVCGDAKRMAKDVEAALVDIVGTNGKRTTEEAVAFVSKLKKDGRFQLDVY